MDNKERKELEELRRFKKLHDASAINRAFARIEAMLDSPFQQRCDTVMSVRAFQALAEALILLKDEVMK